MHQILNRLVFSAFLAFMVSGCATPQSKFDFSREASETASLILPKPLRVLSFDGREANLPMSLEYPYTVTVPAGEHSFEFQYGELWGLGQANELVRGPVMEVEFSALGGETYQIDYVRPESVQNRELADGYLEDFSAWLNDGQGQRVDARSTGVSGILGRKIASMREGKESVDDKPVPVVISAEKSPGDRLLSLQQLWEEANDEEKKAFMQWIAVPGS